MTSKIASPSSILSPSTPINNNSEDQGFFFDVIPDGYEWGKLFYCVNVMIVAMFNWDVETSSKKLLIEDDCLTVKVKDGSGFKTSIGDMVRINIYKS